MGTLFANDVEHYTRTGDVSLTCEWQWGGVVCVRESETSVLVNAYSCVCVCVCGNYKPVSETCMKVFISLTLVGFQTPITPFHRMIAKE